ncbi:putative mitochondrial protein [Vitis vinifera]|uniref:Putative mitochondrial protein n=1 Tax=Vitis vinifera TaxID=29760 RepID=A0A438I215_VITVI|nr:putative mitochondrial protein [Vitis vinifera]
MGKIAILIVYVDDIILTSDDGGELQVLKKFLAREFEIKDLGPLQYFLSMEFARSKKGIFVSQRKYVLTLLDETGLPGCKPIKTPLLPNLRPQLASADKVVNREQFQSMFMDGNLVQWRRKKQPTVARSSEKAEF